MHGLTKLEQHVVGEVYDGADRTDAGGQEAGRHPAGRRRARDVGDGGRISRAEAGVLNRDANAIVFAGGHGGDSAGECGSQLDVVRSRHFPRQTEHAQAVGPVGGDFEIDHGVPAIEGLDRRHLEPAQPQRLGDVLGRRSHGHELTQPRND
jgi:hypothetical protein